MKYKELFFESKTIILYRGVNKQGLKSFRPSSEGVYGPGIYFYTTPLDARSYAGLGGGIILVKVNESDVEIHNNIAVLKDSKKILSKRIVPTDETLNVKTTLAAIEREKGKL